MKSHWLVRLLWGIGLPLILCACLAGKSTPAPAVNRIQAQQTNQPNKIYLSLVRQFILVEGTAPLASNSIYITTLDAATLYNQGCALGSRDLSLDGKQDSVVILHFGYPRMVGSEFGARLYYPASPATNAEIATAVENFGFGYWYCVGADFESHLQIGIGTSNYGGSTYSMVTSAHGQAWARMVNDVNDWFTNSCERSCDKQVSAVGASDIELSWNNYGNSIDWLNGYDQANNYALYNFGAIPGCPYLASPKAQCGGAGYYWTEEQVWMVTFGLSPIFPMPEIYRTDGLNAEQWYLMSLYSYNAHGTKMEFIGPMSQYQACLQRGGCDTIDNTPSQAWQQLYNLLNGDGRTSGETLPYLTDIFWLNEPMPSSPALLNSQGASPTSTTGKAKNAALLEGLQVALKSSNLSAADRSRLEEKQSLAKQLVNAQASGSAKTGSKSSNRSLLPQMQNRPALSPDEKIIEGSEGLVHTWEANIQNLWQGERDGVYYQVLAGSTVDNAEQGLLLVIETIPDQNQRSQHVYLTDGKDGALRILQVRGKLLQLQTANGGKLSFDLGTRTFQK